MDKLEKRILEVSKMVSENLIEAMLDFRNQSQQTNSLADAQKLLSPEINRLDQFICRMLKKHNLSDALFNDIRREEAETGYVIGIVAGLHLAGRADLLPKFAEMYTHTTTDSGHNKFDDDGEFITEQQTH